MKTYMVGGYVRDSILGLRSKDIDYAVVLDDLSISTDDGFELMRKRLISDGYTIFLSTPDCFTVRAKFPEDHANRGMVADFVLARKEVGYVTGTRRPINRLGTLMDDLERRDFTINAMAIDDQGNLIDPFGGRRHLEDKLLKTPTSPSKTMMDDPLRFLRALRFAVTKKMNIDDSIFVAMRDPAIMDKLFTVVSRERIREELLKMFVHDTPASLRMLREVELHWCFRENPGFTDRLFDCGLWMKPTMEAR